MDEYDIMILKIKDIKSKLNGIDDILKEISKKESEIEKLKIFINELEIDSNKNIILPKGDISLMFGLGVYCDTGIRRDMVYLDINRNLSKGLIIGFKETIKYYEEDISDLKIKLKMLDI